MAKVTSSVPIQTDTGLRLSALNPKYLHTNSTSHTWPFSAIAELVDNAYDPDCKASQLLIDTVEYSSKCKSKILALAFTDNGNGMTSNKLYKMLSFGFCEKDKVNIKNHMPVGHYGNGFKSGSMRLGKDALVLTKCTSSKSIGFLSQTYLSFIGAETIIVPMVTWDRNTGALLDKKEEEQSLPIILQHSVLDTTEKIIDEFNNITSKNGTRIIITNLRRTNREMSEFDLSLSNDILIPDDLEGSDKRKFRREERQQHIPASDYSLRAYLSILYLKPKMQIYLRGSKVKTVAIAKSLSNTEVDVYRPVNKKQVKIVFGFSQNVNHYGIMMYHRNRLIKPYVRVGCQLKTNNMGVGVIGVIECDSLQPTHNKQDFDYTYLYRSTMSALGKKLNDYWNEKYGLRHQNGVNDAVLDETINEKSPDQNWAQCDDTNCLKWRRLPDYINLKDLPGKWYCYMHPQREWNSCDVPEEEEESVDNVKPYEKKLKRIEKEMHADKAKTHIMNIEIEKRRREKAEYEVTLLTKEIQNIQKNLNVSLLHSTPISAIRMPVTAINNFATFSQIGQSNIINTPVENTLSTTVSLNTLSLNTTSKSISSTNIPSYSTPLMRRQHRLPSANTQKSHVTASEEILLTAKNQVENIVDTSLDHQDLSSNEDYLVSLDHDRPATFTIKQEVDNQPTTSTSLKRLHSLISSEPSLGNIGTKSKPINLDSSDESADCDEPVQKTLKVGNSETLPGKDRLSTFNNVPSKITRQETLKNCVGTKPFFNFNQLDLSGIDEDIVADLKESSSTEDVILLLAKRSQALRNLRTKVASLIQSIVSSELKMPDVKTQNIDDDFIERLIDQILDT